VSYLYRKEDEYGPNRFDGVPDVFGPYPDGAVHEEGYSKRPVRSDKLVGSSHHQDCTYDDIHLSTCMCFELYSRDYEMERDDEAEAMHQEWWQ